jgi:predicted small metal-binding protein
VRRLDPLSKENQKVTEADMANRKSIDCRDYPSEKNCSLKISGTEEEVLDAATQHAASAHGHQHTPELREQIKSMLKEERD